MHTSAIAVSVFLVFVAFVLGLSFYLGSRAKSAKGYFAAHGQVGWFVNGIAFAGDYLSAASFLGICGMIAFYGYDGFLYSIGFLGGWVVALFVIAEPIKRLGKFTFADALDSQFNSRSIKLSAAISTLIVSLFYLIPQMVGAGALVQPLLGLPQWAGVLIVGTVVITIVVTAGMVSTTWVQFIKGSMLVIFCALLTIAILARGFNVVVATGPAPVAASGALKPGEVDPAKTTEVRATGSLGPLEFLHVFNTSTIVIEKINPKATPEHPEEPKTTKQIVKGGDMLLPGASPTFAGVRSPLLTKKLDFISLMLALFCGTASLPHILIRYYTVKDAAAARKSTVVGIAAIGFFYILTLYIGLGAMVGGPLNPDSNMAAPLLARTFGELPFAIISAIAFTTVLGTVSGLILAASGAVAHDIMENFLKIQLHDHAKVGAAKWAAIVVGIVGMALGVVFQKLNVSFLVGWAFNVAASANLPALVMLLFWKRTTKYGITASIIVGLLTSLTWLMLSVPAYQYVYGFSPADAAAKAIAPFSQPGLVTIPLAFVVLVMVSLMTQRKRVEEVVAV
ncbi:MAG TPA: cation acetate symporter [Tepidisphaeraceae bacterium]|jgi:cation/acetate symporter|nr:cation acetate symporter [Tepidisphaeraceae bacterium]